MTPTVSVILPVFNRAASLGNAMQSVLSQSYGDLELIVVDDGSSVDLRPIVEGFGDPRVRFVRLDQNRGVSAARNTGLSVAKGTFIAFQDSDDQWLPGKLQMQMDLLASLPEDVGVVVHSKVVYGQGEDGSYGTARVSIQPPPQGIQKPGDDQVYKYLTENRISLQNTLFRRDCYPEPLWFDEVTRANADWAFSSSLAQHTRIMEYPDPVVMAFMSNDSISKMNRFTGIGFVRILKRNRDAYARYPKAYGLMMWRIARFLSRHGKPRMARGFYAEGLRYHPGFVVSAAREKLRKLRLRLAGGM